MRKALSYPHRSTISPSGGFTLIELLVAISLLAIAAGALASAFRSGLRLWNRSEGEMRLHQEAQVVLDQISREFRNSIDIPGVAWSATEQEVTFATLRDVSALPSPSQPVSRIVKITYRMVPGPNTLKGTPTGAPSMVLDRREQDLVPDQPGMEKGTSLTSFPTQIEWEYAYASSQGLRWEKEWAARASLPCGIRIHLTLFDPDTQPETFTRTLFVSTRDLTPWND